MTRLEKAEIERLPERYKPLGAWGYFWHTLLFIIPIAGWIACAVCAFGAKNVARRSFARFSFTLLIFFILALAAFVALVVFDILKIDMLLDLVEKLRFLQTLK